MTRFDRVKQVTRKAPLVMNTAKILNDQQENEEITSDQAVEQMIKWAVNSNMKDFWFDIDDLLLQQYETEKWFWLVRRLRNTRNIDW
jgi:hypothetical protein